MDNVSVPRGIFALLVVVLVVCVVAVAFLLGRESMHQAVPTPSMAVASPAAAATPAVAATPASTPTPAPPAVPAATPAAHDGPRVVVQAPPPAAAPPPANTTASSQVTLDAGMRDQVAAYFKQMDNIGPGGLSGDPNAMAQEILQGAMSGDTAKLDDLIRKGEAAERRARAISPPAPCAHYHQQSVALAAESVKMLKSMKQAMQQNDANALMSLSARASQMQSQAEELQREEQSIKRQYHV